MGLVVSSIGKIKTGIPHWYGHGTTLITHYCLDDRDRGAVSRRRKDPHRAWLRYRPKVSYLASQAYLKMYRNNNGWNPLLKVCKSGDISVLTLLLEVEVDLTATNNFGENCINIAQKHGHQELSILLVEKGATLRPVSRQNQLVNDRKLPTLKKKLPRIN